MPLGKLLFMRHGETVANVGWRLDTALPGASLTEHGKQQAFEWGTRTDPRSLAVVATSEALRARQTGRYIMEGMREAFPEVPRHLFPPLQVLPGVYETQGGLWENKAVQEDPEVARAWLGVYYQWMMGNMEAASPGPTGESGADIRQRFLPSVMSLYEKYAGGQLAADGGLARDSGLASDSSVTGDDSVARNVLVVSHGAVTRLAATMMVPQLDRRFAYWSFLANTHTIELEVQQDKHGRVMRQDGHLQWEVTRWGEEEPPFVCHVPPHLDDPANLTSLDDAMMAPTTTQHQ